MMTAPSRLVGRQVGIGVESDYDFLSEEYRRLYGIHGSTAFQSPLWLRMLHDRLVPARSARQNTIAIRDSETGGLIALLPTVIQRSAGVSILQFADFGICDYNGPVADRADLERFASDASFRRSLRKLFSSVDLVLFRKVRSDHFDLARLLEDPKSSIGENPSYECELGDDFDHWRSKVLRNKFTKELGRLQRQTERDHGTYEHRIVLDAGAIGQAFDFLRESQEARQQDSILTKPEYFDFYRDFAIAGAAGGEALTYVSYLAGEPVAVLFGPAGKGLFHAVLIGVDTKRFARISPGTQIIYRVIEQRMREGHTRFDMGLGDPGYKTHFRPEATAMRNTSMAVTTTGRAVGFIYHNSKPLKNVLREFVPNVR